MAAWTTRSRAASSTSLRARPRRPSRSRSSTTLTANAPNKTIVFRLANATPAGSQIKTTTAKLTIIDNEGPGTLDFSSSAYTVLEGANLASITVNRIGASNLKLSVDYATQAALTNPASPIFDYTSISPAQTLTFNPGEVSKTFQVAIADDSTRRGPGERGPRALQSAEPDRRRSAAARPERAGGADDQRRRRVDVQLQLARVLRPGGRPGGSCDDHRQPRRRDQHPRLRQLFDE